MPAKFSRALRAGFVVLAAACALGPATSQAFTLVTPPTLKLFLVPKTGYPTGYIQVRGTVNIGAQPCAVGVAPTPLKFNFYFDASLIWSKTNVVCVNSPTVGIWNTGNSPFIKPPGGPTIGAHVVYMKVSNANTNVAVGNGAQSAYTVVQPPASPTQPSPSPSPSSTGCAVGASTAACPTSSPSNSSCPAAMLPPTGTGSWGDNLVAGLVVAAVLPIAGLTMFGPGTLLAFARRRRRLLMLIGLSALTALTLSCTSTMAGPTPAALRSPATSPSCSA